MKYAKFVLLALSVSALSVSGCAENNAGGEASTGFLGSMTTSVADSLGAIPETISMYANASETHDELTNVKQQLAETQKKVQVLLQANTLHVQSLQNERVKLQREQNTVSVAMRQLKQLKRQLTNQDQLLAELHKVLSAAEIDVAALTKRAGVKGSKPGQLSKSSQPGQAVKAAVKQQKPTPARQTVRNSKAPDMQQMLQKRKSLQQAQALQQARIAQQQQAKLRQQQAAIQQARLRKQQAAQRLKARQQQAQTAQQATTTQTQKPATTRPAQQESRANNVQLQRLLQQRMTQQRSVQELTKTKMPKTLEALQLPK